MPAFNTLSRDYQPRGIEAKVQKYTEKSPELPPAKLNQEMIG